jgi:hypothetical protein
MPEFVGEKDAAEPMTPEQSLALVKQMHETFGALQVSGALEMPPRG